jgi:hypothetical protein
MISKEQLHDLSEAYTAEDILDILDMSNYDLLLLLIEQVEENIDNFQLRPVDTYEL